MGPVIVELLPYILGAALAPLWVIIVLLLLASPNGLAKGSMFVLGMTLTRIAQGGLVGAIFAASSDTAADESGKSPVGATLMLVLGILLLIAAYKKWRAESDPDDPPPKWMQTIEQATALKALGLGAGMIAVGPKYWVFTLSALAAIREAALPLAQSVAAYLSFIVLAQLLLILPLIIYAVAPKGSAALLARANTWLATYNRPISVAVSLIFGLYFSYSGATGLLG